VERLKNKTTQTEVTAFITFVQLLALHRHQFSRLCYQCGVSLITIPKLVETVAAVKAGEANSGTSGTLTEQGIHK